MPLDSVCPAMGFPRVFWFGSGSLPVLGCGSFVRRLVGSVLAQLPAVRVRGSGHCVALLHLRLRLVRYGSGYWITCNVSFWRLPSAGLTVVGSGLVWMFLDWPFRSHCRDGSGLV